MKRYSGLLKELQAGHLLEPGALGDTWAWCNHSPRGDTAPPFMQFFNAPVVNQASKDLLEQFDLGETRFHPIRVLDAKEAGKPWPEPLYILNVGNTKATADLTDPRPSAFSPARLHILGREVLQLQNPEHLIALPSALEGPDIWIDPRIHMTLFLSDDLVRALKKAKLTRGWALKKTLLHQVH